MVARKEVAMLMNDGAITVICSARKKIPSNTGAMTTLAASAGRCEGSTRLSEASRSVRKLTAAEAVEDHAREEQREIEHRELVHAELALLRARGRDPESPREEEHV